MQLQYDPADESCAAYNDPEQMDETPLGMLRVITIGHRKAVVVVHEQDPRRSRRLLHFIRGRESPHEVIYGKRTQENDAVAALYNARNVARDAAEVSGQRDLSKDLVHDMEKLANKHSEDFADSWSAWLTGER